MVNRERKHGVFVVNCDVVVLSSSKAERTDCMHISERLSIRYLLKCV